MKKLLLFIIFILSVFIPNVYAKDNGLGKTSMYIWNIDTVDYSSLDKAIDYLNIDTLYVGSYNDLTDYKHELLFGYAKRKNLKIYLVYGEKIGKTSHIIRIADSIVDYNKNNSYKISGIAVDSEFHTTDEYRSGNDTKKKEMFKTYVDFMKESHTYVKSKNLTFVSCIPVNYDNISESLLEELIKNGADYTQLMNYNKKGMITKIEKEVEYAKKYNKIIESIAELQEPGPNDVTDSITFWNEGLDICNEKLREVKNHYNYSKMKFSYHAYKSAIPLLSRIVDLNSEYNLEIYTKDKNKTPLKVDNIFLDNGKEKIPGISVYNKKTNEYGVYFYGVKYNQEYKIIINGYDSNKTIIKYDSSSDRIKYDELILTKSLSTTKKTSTIATTSKTTTTLLTSTTNNVDITTTSTTKSTIVNTTTKANNITQEVIVDKTDKNDILKLLGSITIIISSVLLFIFIIKEKIKC